MFSNPNNFNFTPANQITKLDTLFADEETETQNANLFYKAPKQPKLHENDTKKEEETSSSSVLGAKIIHTWKLIDQTYKLIGKMGIAIIGSSSQQLSELILYKERRNVIARLQIAHHTELISKKDNFLAFSTNEQSWLIKFANSEDYTAISTILTKFGANIVPEKNAVESGEPHKGETGGRNHFASDTDETKAKSDILNRIAKMGQSMLPSTPDAPINDDVSSVVAIPVPLPRQIVHHSTPILDQTIPQPTNLNYDHFNLLFTENRIQNGETRITLSDINAKLGQILQKLGNDAPASSPEQLKSRLKVAELRAENLSRDLLQQSEKLDKKEEQNQATVGELKEELTTLQHTHAERVRQLEEQISIDKRIIDELNEKVEAQERCINELKTNEKNEIDDLNQQIEGLKLRKSEQEIIGILKESMNRMYDRISGTLNDNSHLESIIAKIIKKTSLEVIQKIEQQ